MEELLNLKKKYEISDKDLYILSKLEDDKKNQSFIEKTKSATKQEILLKKHKLSLSEKQKVLKNLKFSSYHNDENLSEKYKGEEQNEELNAEGKKGFNKIVGIVVAAVLMIFFISIFDKKDNSEINSKTEKVTFNQAKDFMKSRLSDINQTLMASKKVNFNGKTVYMFMSVTENGMTCISGISEFQLDVMSSDCGITEVKIQEWNNL